MKNTATTTVLITTIFVLLFTVIALSNIAIELTIGMCAIGMVLLPYMVVKVLKDTYQTQKTFSDWYEDHPKSDEGLFLSNINVDRDA